MQINTIKSINQSKFCLLTCPFLWIRSTGWLFILAQSLRHCVPGIPAQKHASFHLPQVSWCWEQHCYIISSIMFIHAGIIIFSFKLEFVNFQSCFELGFFVKKKKLKIPLLLMIWTVSLFFLNCICSKILYK